MTSWGISLLVQWLRISHAMQRTQVRSLIWELRSHMPQSIWAGTSQLGTPCVITEDHTRHNEDPYAATNTQHRKYIIFLRKWKADSKIEIKYKRKRMTNTVDQKSNKGRRVNNINSLHKNYPDFSSVQSLSRVQLFASPWIAARLASMSITNSWSSLRLTSIGSVMLFSHLILCHPLLLLPPIPPSIRVFSNESTLCMWWPKYWSFSFSIIASKEHPGLTL